MQEAGTVLHLARSGRLIIKASSQVPDGTLLVDSDGRRTGRVMETVGPVVSPYLSVQPMTDRVERLVGSKLFLSETPERNIRGTPRLRYKSSNDQGGRSGGRRRDDRRGNRHDHSRTQRKAESA